MLLFAAWLLAGLGVAWWAFPYGVTFFTVPLLAVAVVLWLCSVGRLTSKAGWSQTFALLLAFGAFVVMIAPAALMAPSVNWALLSHRRGAPTQGLRGIVLGLVVSILGGAAAGWLQSLAVQWRTGRLEPSRRMVLLTASFGPAVILLIGAISLFWPLTD